MKLRRLPFALLLTATLLLLTALAPDASAQYQRRYDRGNQVAHLAHELDDAAYQADQLSRHQSPGYHAVDAAFARLSQAANDFHRVVETGRDAYGAERAFDRVAERYYDLRWELRVFHGPDYVRAAYHRINAPMEVLYRHYRGRDLYRDYERLRLGRHQQPAPRYNPRPDVHVDRHDDRGNRGNRGNRGRGRGRGNGRN